MFASNAYALLENKINRPSRLAEEPAAAGLIWSCRQSNQSNAYRGEAQARTAGGVGVLLLLPSVRMGMAVPLGAEMLLLPSAMTEEGAGREQTQGGTR